MLRSTAAASLLCSLVLSAAAAELPQKETRRPGVAVSEFLERSSKMPQGPGETVLIKAIAELKAKEGVTGAKQEQAQGTREPYIFRLRNVPVAEVAKALQKRVDEHQARHTAPRQASSPLFVCEPVSNCLLVSASPATMEDLRQWIAACDADRVMVSVDVLIASVLPGTEAKGLLAALAIPEEGEDGSTWLAAAEAQKRLEVLSRPTIMTLDHQQAQIRIGEQRRVTDAAIRREPFVGLQADITPHVAEEGPIRLDVALAKTGLAKPDDERAEVVHEIDLRTTVSIEDGETAIVSGQASDGRPVVVALTPHVVPRPR